MEFNTTFTIKAECNKYDKSSTSKDAKKVTLDLKMNTATAANFLFKFSPNVFTIGEYKVVIKSGEGYAYPIISLFKDDYIYIVSNTGYVFSQISAAYYSVQTTNKLNSLLSLDLETMLESEETGEGGILDEFDINNN